MRERDREKGNEDQPLRVFHRDGIQLLTNSSDCVDPGKAIK